MSSLVVIDSDWHAHQWPQFSLPATGGLNTRVLDNLQVRMQVLNWCIAHRPLLRVTVGDEFHTPGLTGTLDVAVQKAVIDAEEKFVQHGIRTVKTVGNHDQSTRSGEAHALAAFQRAAEFEIIETPQWVHLRGRSRKRGAQYMLVVPYARDPEVIKAALHTVLQGPDQHVLTVVHYEMDGAVVETGWRVKAPVTHADLPAGGWTLFGHHHTHQQWTPRSGVVGIPLQHTRINEGQAGSFLVLDLDKQSLTRVYTQAPEFRTLVWIDTLEVPQDGHFYRITGVPASKVAPLRNRGMVVEAMDEDDAEPGRSLAVTVSDLPGAVRRYAEAGYIQPSDASVDPDVVKQYSLEVLERCLAGTPLPLEETT